MTKFTILAILKCIISCHVETTAISAKAPRFELFYSLLVLGAEPRALCMLGKCSSTELYLQAYFYVLDKIMQRHVGSGMKCRKTKSQRK